jgi:phosphatidylinositol alpha-1,6-mannosyltransferase
LQNQSVIDSGAASKQVAPEVLVVSELFPPDIGGSAVLFREIYSRVPGDVTVLTQAREGRPECDGRIRIRERQLTTRRWGFVDPRGWPHYLSVARDIRRFSRTPGAVVHCGRALPEGVAAMLARSLGGAPYVCWTHGEDLASAWTSRELTLLVKRVYGRAALAFANSRNTASLLRSAGVPSDRIAVVYPGVDSNRFSPEVSAHSLRARLLGNAQCLLLSIGRLQRRKGHDLAIQAVASLKSRGDRFRYVIVGDGEERPRLEALVREAGVSAEVQFLGEVDASALPAYYAAADIFLLPNREDRGDIEGFGIVFLEAASSSKPVIGGRSGGVPEAVVHGQTGFLVSGTDPQELAIAIRALAEDQVLCARLGAAGRERVLKAFTWQRAADVVWAAHERIVHRK